MQSKATTVKAYLAELPADRRAAIEAVRATILKNLNKGFEEGMQYGMIGYFVPHSLYPDGYHCTPEQPLPFAGLASQKQYMSLYVMSLYLDGADLNWFVREWAKTGKKLDMGKCCIRFKKLDDIPLDVIGAAFKRATVKDYIAYYETAMRSSRKKPTTKVAAGKKAASKPVKKTTKKVGKKKAKA